VEAVFGMHNWPGMKKWANSPSRPGPVMASSNEFKITIRGKGSHAAMPHNGIDPVPIACQMVQAFQTIISRNKKPVDAGVISVTMIHAGEATNVVPDSLRVAGHGAHLHAEVLDLIEARMKQMAEHTCAAHDATCEFEFVRNYPPTINSAPEAEFARQVMAEHRGRGSTCWCRSPPWAPKTSPTCCRPSPAPTASLPTATAGHREMGHGGGTLHAAQPELRLQ
jgi:hippurate hydrolase